MSAPQSRTANWMLCALFCGGLLLPLLGMVFSSEHQDVSEIENRRLSPFPELECKSVAGIPWPKTASARKFTPAFEQWFQDRIGFRETLLTAHAFAKRQQWTTQQMTGQSPGTAPRSDVIVGRNGWLFFAGENVIDDFRRIRPLSTKELEQWQAVFTERQRWLAARGIRYLLVIAPNKQTIYPEQLPRSLNRVGTETRLDQLQRVLKESPVNLLDLRPQLLAAKTDARLYHQTDTHWNQRGAFVGYQAILNELASDFPEMRPRMLSDFKITEREFSTGDLARLLHFQSAAEMQPLFHFGKPRQATLKKLPPSEFREEFLSQQTQADLPRAVVLHDSFFKVPMHFFNEHFHQVHYVWTDEFPVKLLEDSRPAIVIQELVERRLMHAPPANPDLYLDAAPAKKLAWKP